MKSTKLDNIIIGGGLAGWSVAYWLKRLRPHESILVLHSSRPNLAPASLLNAGFLTVGSLNFYAQTRAHFGERVALDLLDFCEHNHRALREQGILTSCKSYVQNGSFSLSSQTPFQPPPAFEQLETPPIPLKKDESVWRYSHDGSVQPAELLGVLAKSSEVTASDSVVTHICSPQVSTSSGTYEAEKIFLATNAWVRKLCPELPVRPVRAQALRTQPISKGLIANYYFSDELAYARISSDRKLILGGMRGLDPLSEETDGFEVNTKIQSGLLQFAEDRFGEKLRVEEQWCGIMGFTDSHLPLAGSVGDVHCLAGFSGHGMGMAFLLSRFLVESVVLGGSLPNWARVSSSIQKPSGPL